MMIHGSMVGYDRGHVEGETNRIDLAVLAFARDMWPYSCYFFK